jgi:hypothetical protein
MSAEGNSTPVGDTARSILCYLRRCRLHVMPASPAPIAGLEKTAAYVDALPSTTNIVTLRAERNASR